MMVDTTVVMLAVLKVGLMDVHSVVYLVVKMDDHWVVNLGAEMVE